MLTQDENLWFCVKNVDKRREIEMYWYILRSLRISSIISYLKGVHLLHTVVVVVLRSKLSNHLACVQYMVRYVKAAL